MWVVAGRDNVVDDQDPALRVHGSAAVCKDLHALRDSFRGHVLILLSASDDRGLVKEHALQLWVRFENRSQEAPMSTADIHERPDSRELLRFSGSRPWRGLSSILRRP